MEKLSANIDLIILEKENFDKFLFENQWLDKNHFREICLRYRFPEKNITVIVEKYYIDVAYRDIYYHYWARFHFEWPRHCKRIFLFQNAHLSGEFYDRKYRDSLNKDFLGTIVIRPAYSNDTDEIETDHTFGRTLLDPYKMICRDLEGNISYPFKYLKTTEYKFHLLGNVYKIQAFPFSSQDGVAMKCAETAIHLLCDFEATSSALYAKVLPSEIQDKLKIRLSERILPSHGLYCNDISYLLREFGFSPMIYVGIDNRERAMNQYEEMIYHDFRIGLISENLVSSEKNNIGQKEAWDEQHITDLKKWFHYYVESALPVLAITAPNQEVNKHATLIIGHSKKKRSINDCRIYRLGKFPCMDTAEFYEDYIIQDDNQIPYIEEKMDRFTSTGNYKLEAFIVPLERHVFLEAASAVSICDAFVARENEMFANAIDNIIVECKIFLKNTKDDENKKQYSNLIDAMTISEDNPITIRYYLVNCADYKQYRIATGDSLSDKRFYADIPMPKSAWIAEISTYRCYEMGYAFAELVLDATASNQSKANSLLLLRVAQLGVYRLPNETYNDLRMKMVEHTAYTDLTGIFTLFSNFQTNDYEN